MQIEVSEDRKLILKEVYNSIEFRTDAGQRLLVCMRDGGFELGVRVMNVNQRDPHVYIYEWYSIQGGVIKKLESTKVPDVLHEDAQPKEDM
jgi:hypothetical protein